MSEKRIPLDATSEDLFGRLRPDWLGNSHDRDIGEHWIDELQAARAKDAELIQRLVDALAEQVQPSLDERFRGEVWYRHMAIIKDAEAAGFTPSE